MILTWGLIGPGKGIERVIDAMASMDHLASRPRYLVAGQTHPSVLAADGEAYRNARIEQASRNGVSDSVLFDATYRDVDSLTALIQSCSVVVLPYDTKDQVTSGVLVDAIAAGRPVIATAFPHAVEMLASGAGIVVDHDDPEALVDALRRVLVEPGLADAMAAEASRLAPAMGWPVVAGAYVEAGGPPAQQTSGIGMTGPVVPDFDHLCQHDRRSGHLRARPVRRAEAGARLLHRRHGPRPGRCHHESLKPLRGCSTLRGPALASSPMPRAPMAVTGIG